MEPAVTEQAATRPHSTRVWTVFAAFAALIVAHLVAGLVLAVGAMVFRVVGETLTNGAAPSEAELEELTKSALDSKSFLLASFGVAATLSPVFALLPAALSPAPWRERLRLRPAGLSRWLMARLVIVFLAMSTISDALFGTFGWNAGESLKMISSAFSGLSLPGLLGGALILGLTGCGEELFFRGYLQTRLCQRWGRWAGILVAAALFGLMHMDLIHSALAFGIGIFLGWMTERSGSIVPAMAAHAINNALWALGVGLIEPLSRAANGALLVLFTAVSVAEVLYLRGALPPGDPASESAAASAVAAPVPGAP